MVGPKALKLVIGDYSSSFFNLAKDFQLIGYEISCMPAHGGIVLLVIYEGETLVIKKKKKMVMRYLLLNIQHPLIFEDFILSPCFFSRNSQTHLILNRVSNITSLT